MFRRKRRADTPAEDLPAAEATGQDNSLSGDSQSTRRPVRRRSWAFRPGALLLVIAVMALGVALFLRGQNQLPIEIEQWYPLALIVPGVVWLLGALVRRSGRGMQAAAALLGAGVSLLLGAQANIPVGSTLVGIMFIAVGTSILLRGILMGRQPIRI
jgi:cytochrome bd-type quinol oxidase subunit 1